MAKKKIRTTFGGRAIRGPKTKKRGVAEFGVIPDPRTKTEILRCLDLTQDALSSALDAKVVVSKASLELHARIQDLETTEDNLKEQLTQMRGQRDQLLDAIEDYDLADQEYAIKKQNRDVAYARMCDLHSEIGTERSNEMNQDLVPRQQLLFNYNRKDNKWREST